MSDHDFGQDLGQWPTQLTSRTDHLSSCAICIDGFVPDFDPICGPGFLRCSSAKHLNIACHVCGFSTFYPIGLRENGAAWAADLCQIHGVWALLCRDCNGVIGLRPMSAQWANDEDDDK